MDRRLELHRKLEDILGSSNVYFQAPPSTGLVYPCIIYKLTNIVPKFADDAPYVTKKQYTVTHIDRRPDSEVIDKLSMLPHTRMIQRMYIEGLNHTLFNTYT